MSNIPDIQEMDLTYDRYYLVPWPDYQKFEELAEDDDEAVIPAMIGTEPVAFVNAYWVGNGCSYDE